LQSTTADELATQLAVTGESLSDIVRSARQLGTEVYPCSSHGELPRWWAQALEQGLGVEAALVLDKMRLHVPGVWRSSELQRVTQGLGARYGSHILPALTVEFDRGRFRATFGPWTSMAADAPRSVALKQVSRTEVGRAIRALVDPPGWLAEWNGPDRAWFAASQGFTKTTYVPALEPIDIDPRETLRAPVPPQFVVGLQIPGDPFPIPILGPFASIALAENQFERAQAIVDQMGWGGALTASRSILPGRLTMVGQIARYLRRVEHA